MQSLNINQLVIDGLAPLSYASSHVVQRLFDMNGLTKDSVEDMSKSSISLAVCYQQSIDHIRQIIATYSPFRNKNVTALLRAALVSDRATFRQAVRDFKMTHKKIFAREINQHDQYQNTLVWYLTIASLYESIEELVRLSTGDLDINVKNGLFKQTILHYAVTHASIEEIRLLLDMGVDTNHHDRYGQTALHYVALCGTKDENDVQISNLLLDYGIMLK